MTNEERLRRAAMNRYRERLFGPDAVLRTYEMTPADGEVELDVFFSDWFGQRVENTTTTTGVDQSEWQFQIAATDDWESSQSFMHRVRVVTVDGRRWAVSKVEKPVGVSLVWKLRAREQ